MSSDFSASFRQALAEPGTAASSVGLVAAAGSWSAPCASSTDGGAGKAAGGAGKAASAVTLPGEQPKAKRARTLKPHDTEEDLPCITYVVEVDVVVFVGWGGKVGV